MDSRCCSTYIKLFKVIHRLAILNNNINLYFDGHQEVINIFNFIKKKTEEVLEPWTETFERRTAYFITTDGQKHCNSNYKWCKVSGLTCGMGEYAMISVKSDGYISDDDGVMYPLNNVLSVEWKLIESVVKQYRHKDKYKIWFSDKDIAEMKDV